MQAACLPANNAAHVETASHVAQPVLQLPSTVTKLKEISKEIPEIHFLGYATQFPNDKD
jgi:hypothetical protein